MTSSAYTIIVTQRGYMGPLIKARVIPKSPDEKAFTLRESPDVPVYASKQVDHDESGKRVTTYRYTWEVSDLSELKYTRVGAHSTDTYHEKRGESDA